MRNVPNTGRLDGATRTGGRRNVLTDVEDERWGVVTLRRLTGVLRRTRRTDERVLARRRTRRVFERRGVVAFRSGTLSILRGRVPSHSICEVGATKVFAL